MLPALQKGHSVIHIEWRAFRAMMTLVGHGLYRLCMDTGRLMRQGILAFCKPGMRIHQVIRYFVLSAALVVLVTAMPALAANPFGESDLSRVLNSIDRTCLGGASVAPEDQVIKCTVALGELSMLHNKADSATEAAGISLLSGILAMNEATAYVAMDKNLSVRACGSVEAGYALVSSVDPQLLSERLRQSLINLQKGLGDSADRCGHDFGAFPGGSASFTPHKFSDVDLFRIEAITDQGCTIAAPSATPAQIAAQCTLAIANIAILQAKPQPAVERAGLGSLAVIYLVTRAHAYNKIDHSASPRTCLDMRQALNQMGAIDGAQFDSGTAQSFQSIRSAVKDAIEACSKN